MKLNAKLEKLQNQLNIVKEKEKLIESITLENIETFDSVELKKFIDKTKKAIAKSGNPEEALLTCKDNEIYQCKTKISQLNHKIKIVNDMITYENLPLDEKKDFMVDLSFYRSNVSCYWLVLSCVIFNLVYLITLLDVMDKTFWVGISILFNIAALLFIFIAAIKIKNYKKSFNIPTIVFGVYTIFRIMVALPLFVKLDFKSLEINDKLIIIGASLYISIACITGGIISTKKIRLQEQFLKDGKIEQKYLSK